MSFYITINTFDQTVIVNVCWCRKQSFKKLSKMIFVQIQALMQIPSYIFRFWQKHISNSKCYLKRFEYSLTIMVLFSKAFLNKRTILELLRFIFYGFKITENFLLFCFFFCFCILLLKVLISFLKWTVAA